MPDDEPERNAGSPQLVETGWRPISEAPKDGTVILVYRPSGTPDSNYCGMIGTDSFGTVRTYPNDWADSPQNAQPTHWMPLPPPPDAPGSPQLDEPLRSRERAALDIAVKALRETRPRMMVAVRANVELPDFDPAESHAVRDIDKALTDIAALVPAVK